MKHKKKSKSSIRVTREQMDDIEKLKKWLVDNVPTCTDGIALSFAGMVVTARNYDRTQPVRDNAIGGHKFDLPSPTSL